jgi:hypothetical protein
MSENHSQSNRDCSSSVDLTPRMAILAESGSQICFKNMHQVTVWDDKIQSEGDDGPYKSTGTMMRLSGLQLWSPHWLQSVETAGHFLFAIIKQIWSSF